jgi:hypothetical protein
MKVNIYKLTLVKTIKQTPLVGGKHKVFITSIPETMQHVHNCGYSAILRLAGKLTRI